jgi:hypothetical protein
MLSESEETDGGHWTREGDQYRGGRYSRLSYQLRFHLGV